MSFILFCIIKKSFPVGVNKVSKSVSDHIINIFKKCIKKGMQEKEKNDTTHKIRGAAIKNNTMASENWHGNQLVVMAII